MSFASRIDRAEAVQRDHVELRTPTAADHQRLLFQWIDAPDPEAAEIWERLRRMDIGRADKPIEEMAWLREFKI